MSKHEKFAELHQKMDELAEQIRKLMDDDVQAAFTLRCQCEARLREAKSRSAADYYEPTSDSLQSWSYSATGDTIKVKWHNHEDAFGAMHIPLSFVLNENGEQNAYLASNNNLVATLREERSKRERERALREIAEAQERLKRLEAGAPSTTGGRGD